MTGSHDARMWDKIEKCPSVSVAWYLMAAYLYYAHDVVIISDGAFDRLAQYLRENWWIVDDHPHSRFITEDDLEAGTLLMDYETLPTITKDAAWRLYRELS